MNEHRKDERKKLITFTPVHDARKRTLLGYLGDLSMQGAMLIGERPMEIDKHIVLAINFPETAAFPARDIVIPARVAWCRHEEHTEYFDTGVEFQNVEPHNEEIIKAVLERYQFRRETQS